MTRIRVDSIGMEENLKYSRLIIKFLQEEISGHELEILMLWLKEDPENRHLFDRSNMLWQETRYKIDDSEIEIAWNHLSEKTGIGQNKKSSVVVLKKGNFRMILAAASIAFILTMGGLSLLYKDWQLKKQISQASTMVRTGEGEKASVYLSDSTQVFLNSGTIIRYGSHYNIKERFIRLKGEAYFNVRTNPDMPFVVNLGKINVSATGTRFNVFSYDNDNRIEMTLEEGKIHVLIDGKEPIELSSGQQVVYFTKTDTAVIREVPTEIYTSWKENKLRLIDTPLEEALRKIARRYNVTFEIRNRDLLDLKYTATFIDESIEEVMQMLKTVSPIDYKISNRMTIDDDQYLKPKIIIQ